MNQTAQTEFSLDSLLDGTLDDIADLPTFEPYPDGLHSVIMNWEFKEINNHPSYSLKLTGLETKELANPNTDTPISKDQTTNILYMLDNEMGQGKWKEILKQLAEHYGKDKSARQLMELSNGNTVSVVTKKKQDKNNKDIWRNDIMALVVE